MTEYMDYNEWLEKLNKEQKEIINDYREQNFELREDLGTYKNELIDKTKYIDTLNKNIEELVEVNRNLQQQLDNFYYEQSRLKETDFYIKALKKQLFESYLLQQHNERLISELKEALSSYNNFVDEMFPE